jgi:hypothetical protein
MSYKRDAWTLKFGGVNLVGAGDNIPDDDSLEVTNFRVDRYGYLRSRHGNTSSEQCTFSGGSADALHTARRLAGRRYWGWQAAGGSDGRLQRNTTYILSGLANVAPFGLAAAGRYVWIMNQAADRQVRDNGTSLYLWQPPKPGSALSGTPNGTGGITGTYYYYVTFGTATAAGDENFESKPSAVSAAIDATAGVDYIALASIPTAPAAPSGLSQCVNNRAIYRVGGHLAEPTLVAYIYDNSTTTYDDHRLDSEVADTPGILMEDDHDPPPAANGVVTYMNRLVAYRDSVNPRRVYYTPPGKPWYFPGSDNGTSGNWFDVDDNVLHISVKPRSLYIYTATSIWRVGGDIEENPPELTRSDYGLMSPRAVASSGLTDFFLAREGLCEFNGDYAKLISPKLDPIFHDDAVFVARGAGIQHNPFEASSMGTASMTMRSGRVWLSVMDTAGVRQTWIYELASGRWVKDSRRLFNFLNEGQAGELIGCFYQTASGSSHVGAYNLEDSLYDQVGATYAVAFHSRYNDQGAPEQFKVYEDILVEADTGGLSMTVKVYTNNGELSGDEISVGSVTTSTRQQTVIQLNTGGSKPGIRAKNLAVRLECTNTGQSIAVYKVVVHYFVEPREAKSFDSDETDLGTEKVKQYKRLQLDINAGGAVDWKLYVELPSGAMASPTGCNGTIAATTTRAPRVVVLPDGIEGRLVRLTLIAQSSTFQLYGAALLIRPLGEYHDGSNSEKFITEAITV